MGIFKIVSIKLHTDFSALLERYIYEVLLTMWKVTDESKQLSLKLKSNIFAADALPLEELSVYVDAYVYIYELIYSWCKFSSLLIS